MPAVPQQGVTFMIYVALFLQIGLKLAICFPLETTATPRIIEIDQLKVTNHVLKFNTFDKVELILPPFSIIGNICLLLILNLPASLLPGLASWHEVRFLSLTGGMHQSRATISSAVQYLSIVQQHQPLPCLKRLFLEPCFPNPSGNDVNR